MPAPSPVRAAGRGTGLAPAPPADPLGRIERARGLPWHRRRWCARERSRSTWPRVLYPGWAALRKKPGTSDIEIVCAKAAARMVGSAPPARRRTAHRLSATNGGGRSRLRLACQHNVVASPWTMATPTEATACRRCPPKVRRGRVGQEHRVPEFLERFLVLALPRPSGHHQLLYPRCSIVPPERRWQDKVMVICWRVPPFRGYLTLRSATPTVAISVHLTGGLQPLFARRVPPREFPRVRRCRPGHRGRTRFSRCIAHLLNFR